MTKKPPWEKPKPKAGASQKLSDAQKEAARKRAEAAGRRYPNLVDNMWALHHAGREKRGGG